MYIHGSREIAEAMIARANRLPRSVPVTRPCKRCDGNGRLERQPRGSLCAGTDPGMVRVSCPDCDEGRVDVLCEGRGHGCATVIVVDDLGYELGLCDECAKPHKGMDADELAIAWGLRNAVAMEIEVVS